MGGPAKSPRAIDPAVDWLRKRREELGWTQAKLAKLSGTRQSAISDTETGRTSPTIITLRKIAEALGTGIELRRLTFVDREIAYLRSLDAEQLERELLSRRWYVHPNDLIGGHCVMPIDAPPSSGCFTIADFVSESQALHIADLHNRSIATVTWIENPHLPAIDDFKIVSDFSQSRAAR